MKHLSCVLLALAVLGCRDPAVQKQRSTEEWLRLLQDPEVEVRCAAVKALAARGPDTAGIIPALLDAAGK